MITIAYSPVKREIVAQDIVELTVCGEAGEATDLRLSYEDWDEATDSAVQRLRIEVLGGTIRKAAETEQSVTLDL